MSSAVLTLYLLEEHRTSDSVCGRKHQLGQVALGFLFVCFSLFLWTFLSDVTPCLTIQEKDMCISVGDKIQVCSKPEMFLVCDLYFSLSLAF